MQTFIPTGSRFLRQLYFLFLLCILVLIIYAWLTISIITAYILTDLLSLMSDNDDFLPSKISVSKYMAKIKLTVSTQTRSTVMILSIRTDMPGQTVQRSSLIRVYTVCHSVCIVWTHYSTVEPHSSNFRVITTTILVVRIFRKFTVCGNEFLHFFCCSRGCSKLQTHAKCDPAFFRTNALKRY